ncbi:hypothetical protein ONZ45_g1574 [Pleurotus djamor]|nr:hypothetical protein ONZ45_g1574 [Pleurotus djamor]
MFAVLFTSFSFGAVFSTIALATLSERLASRKWSFVAGSLVTITSQLMLWEAPSYQVMLIARVIQGIGSSIAWIFGLALICDFSPPGAVGGQIGVALSGVAIGSVLGPPIGSLVYEHFGTTGPLTLSVLLAGLDLIGRLLILERRADGSSLEIPQTNELRQQVSGDGKVKTYSLIQTMKRMGKSPRLVCCFCLNLFTSGIVMAIMDTSLPLHLKTDYNLTTTHVGLFLLIGGAPTFAASPVSGYLTDKLGAEWVITLGMALAIPWWLVLFLHMKVGLLAAVYAIGLFITIGVYVSCSAEMAKASRKIEGVQYTHVYAVSLLMHGIGTLVGPIISGQIYANLHNFGWTAICIVIAGIRDFVKMDGRFPFELRFPLQQTSHVAQKTVNEYCNCFVVFLHPPPSFEANACTMKLKELTRLGYKWRSSSWFVTTVVGFGIFVDVLVYTILIPVSPFYLNHKGYDNVPALVGWLLTAFSFGLVTCTIPLAILSERFNSRKWPLVSGLLVLAASQFMFWEAPYYPIMVVARIIQGVSSALVWIFGLALICDCTPPEVVGRQLGFAMSGFALGTVLGPPLGSLLYDHFGMAGPLTLGASVAGVDLIGRLLIIELRLDGTVNSTNSTKDEEIPETMERQPESPVVDKVDGEVKSYTFIQVMKRMGDSPRLLCSFSLELFVFGMVVSMIETSLPLRLKDAYNLTPTQVGLFLLAGGALTFIASPIGGYLTDKFGSEWTMPLGMALAIPWWLLLLIHMKLGVLIAIFAIGRFISVGVYAACSTEMARASKNIEGVQCKAFAI